MITPQRVGFTKIDHDRFTALIAAKLTGAGYQILLAVFRKTLGFHRENAPILLTDFRKLTQLSRQSVRLAIKLLETRNIIYVERDGTRKTIYGLKDEREWLIGKSNHPRMETKSPQTRKPVKTRTTDIKESIKDNKDDIYSDNSQGTPTFSPSGKPLPFPGEDDTRLIIDYLRSIPSGQRMWGIVRATGLDSTVVGEKLHQYKGELFTYDSLIGWQLIDRGISKSEPVGSITEPKSTTEETTYRGKVRAYLGAHGPAAIKAWDNHEI